MRNFSILLLTIGFMTLFTACKKEMPVQNNGITGKWKLVEQYDAYANGGSFSWQAITAEYSDTLIFSPNGNYTRKFNVSANFQECVGTYTLSNSTTLAVNSNCNTVTENMIISELTATSLIIDRQGIEGKIRYKYSATE